MKKNIVLFFIGCFLLCRPGILEGTQSYYGQDQNYGQSYGQDYGQTSQYGQAATTAQAEAQKKALDATAKKLLSQLKKLKTNITKVAQATKSNIFSAEFRERLAFDPKFKEIIGTLLSKKLYRTALAGKQHEALRKTIDQYDASLAHLAQEVERVKTTPQRTPTAKKPTKLTKAAFLAELRGEQAAKPQYHDLENRILQFFNALPQFTAQLEKFSKEDPEIKGKIKQKVEKRKKAEEEAAKQQQRTTPSYDQSSYGQSYQYEQPSYQQYPSYGESSRSSSEYW